jgi:DNA polymerase-3 subunit beta
MNVTIEREAILRILGRTQGVVDKRHSMAVLTNALVEVQDKQISIVATDLEVSLKQTAPARVGEPGKAAASARTLFEIVRESSADEISLRSLDNQWIEISYGKSNFKLMGIDPDEYPGMPQVATNGAKATRFEVDAGDLLEMVRKTVFAVSGDDTRSNLAGVYLTRAKKKGQLRMVATDGHRLAVIDRVVGGTVPEEGAILPRRGLAEIGKMLGEEMGKVSVNLSGNEAMVTLGDSVLSMRLVEGTFPDYQKVIPSETPNRLKGSRDELLHTLRRVSILSSERARGVRFKLSGNTLELSANNPDMGEATEELAVEYSGADMEIGFNAKYLIDVLGVLPEGSSVEIGFGDELSPGVLQGDDPTYRYVVMPMRI